MPPSAHSLVLYFAGALSRLEIQLPQSTLSAISCCSARLRWDRRKVCCHQRPEKGCSLLPCHGEGNHCCSTFYSSPLERGWRKQKDGGLAQPKVRLRQEVVSISPQKRGQRIAVPVRKLFAKEKRPYGLGMVGKLTNRTYRKRIDSYVKRQIEDMDDHR